MLRITTVAAAAALGFLSLAAPAAAAGYLIFVSATGNDANTCLVQAQPCKTLQRAVNVTAADGEVRLLTRLTGGATINKSITIEGADNTVIGTININNASARVVLRRLDLNGRGAVLHGVNIISAAAVHIEDCTVERYTNDGISLISTALMRLVVSNTLVQLNGSDGLHAEDVNANVSIENSRFEGMTHTGLFLKVRNATILRSVSYGNVNHGIQLRTQVAKLTEVTANENGANGLYSDETTAKVAIENSHFEGNGGSGLYLQVAKVSVTGSTASGNSVDGMIFVSLAPLITESSANDNGGNGFDIRAGANRAVLDGAQANGNVLYGLWVRASAKAVMTRCVFSNDDNSVGTDVSVRIDGTLYTTQTNYFFSRTGNSPTVYPQQ